jgi:hypothetical protein
MEPVTVNMPLALTPELIAAVREHPTTRSDDMESWHKKLGWLMCAWDVIVATRTHNNQQTEGTKNA